MLVPTDFSPASDLALDYAVEMARRYGASIDLLHVLEDLMFTAVYPDVYFAELPALRQQMTEEAERRLGQDVRKCAAANVDARARVVVGRPATAIMQEATDKAADLIVMGTHARPQRVRAFRVGSVAERVVGSAPCPVLTVRQAARQAGES